MAAPPVLWEGFIGPAYRDRSVNADAETCVNLFLSTLQSSGNTKRAFLYGTPALKSFAAVDTEGTRGWFSQDGRTFVVVGDTLYEKGGGAPPVSASVDLLIVGGGGGGASGGTAGNGGGGGGGGGGLVTETRVLSSGAYAVAVGAGGAGSVASNTAGTNGVASSVTGSPAASGGGGGGSSAAGASAGSGGCGGGAGDAGGVAAIGGGGTQGFSGGTNGASAGVGAAGAGGGGMGAVGTDTTGGGTNPAGGAGLANGLSGAAVTYSAGGRGGSRSGGETGPVGGANTGNGGGGGGGGSTGPGSAGGSGTVIFSYVTGGLTAAGGVVTNVGGRTIHTFTTSGTFTIAAAPMPPSSGSPDFAVIGTIANDGQPVSFASNGRGGEQLLIVGGGEVKVFSLLANTLSAAIVLPLTNLPVMCCFLNGYFLLSEADTIRVWFSALFDGTLWDALDFFARSQSSDNVVGIKALSDRIGVFGSLTTDLYYTTEDADNPFAPYPESLIQEGAMAPWSIGVLGESFVWVSQDNEGQGRMVRSSGGAPERISTAAIDYALATYANLDGQELLTYEQEGHAFACWSFPNAGDHGVTWCFDARESALRQEPIWHQRADWLQDDGAFSIWSARGCCQADGVIYVGDRLTGDLYTLDLDTYENANGLLIAERTAPYIADSNQWLFVDQIELGAETGVGLSLGQGVDPVADGIISRNSGHLWDSPVSAPLGASGDYDTATSWYQCGRVRADRFVFRVRISDPVKRALGPGLWIRVTPGSGLK